MEKSKQDKMNALLNRSKKQQALAKLTRIASTGAEDIPPTRLKTDTDVKKANNEDCVLPSCSFDTSPSTEDEKKQLLMKKAKEKLLFEAKRAKDRADQYGPQGWLKPKSLATNKEFLRRTLQSTISRKDGNREKSKKISQSKK